MEAIKNDDFEEIACGFQCSQIAIIDSTLARHGIDASKRAQIVEEMISSLGTLLDQCWTESDVGRHFPIVLFADKHWEADPDSAIQNSGSFSWSEYASGNCHRYYEEQNGDPNSAVHGPLGED